MAKQMESGDGPALSVFPKGQWILESFIELDWFKLNWLEAYQPSWLTVLVVVAVAVYSAWYYLLVVNKPRLVGGGSALKQHIVSHCPILSQYYYPTFWAPNCHFTTIGRAKLQTCTGVVYERYSIYPGMCIETCRIEVQWQTV